MRLRRTMQFIPGNNPGMLGNGGVLGADSVILDIEDSVSPYEKDAARLLVSHALINVDYGTSEKVVRVNPLDTYAEQDIKAIVPCRPDTILIPKVQTADDIKQVVEWITAVESKEQTPVKLVALMETPLGLINAYSIAQADKRVEAIVFGAEDYTANIGAQRTEEGVEILNARCLLVNAAKAAGVQVLDTPYTDVTDDEGMIKDAMMAKQLGFTGKLSINPRHIELIHSVFNPNEKEIDWALRVGAALRKAESEGSGAINLDGKMIDKPIVDRANRILELARFLCLLKHSTMDEME